MSFPLPALLSMDPQTGAISGRTRRYEKRIDELGGLFADEVAFAEIRSTGGSEIAYRVDEYRPSERAGDVIFGTSTLYPGKVGDEFLMTRGHIHRISDRPEIYVCQAGHGVMLMELTDGTIRAEELVPNAIVYVAPHWIHRSVNVGNTPFITLFCYPADAGQDYDIIATAGGMKERVVDNGSGGWALAPNPRYRGRAAGGAAL
jgi:glucose-6-phosphate isomerase, archaeal